MLFQSPIHIVDIFASDENKQFFFFKKIILIKWNDITWLDRVQKFRKFVILNYPTRI